jgi:hypothetical protein
MLIAMPELGSLDNKQVASLAGLERFPIIRVHTRTI